MIGILAALEHRRHSGRGQRVELNLFTCAISAQQQELTYYLNHGEIPSRPTENHGSIWATAPFGIYPTSDGYLAIAMTPCPIVGKALDMPELAQYDTNALMLEHRKEIYLALAEHLAPTPPSIGLRCCSSTTCGALRHRRTMTCAEDPQALYNGAFWEVPIGDGHRTLRRRRLHSSSRKRLPGCTVVFPTWVRTPPRSSVPPSPAATDGRR